MSSVDNYNKSSRREEERNKKTYWIQGRKEKNSSIHTINSQHASCETSSTREESHQETNDERSRVQDGKCFGISQWWIHICCPKVLNWQSTACSILLIKMLDILWIVVASCKSARRCHAPIVCVHWGDLVVHFVPHFSCEMQRLQCLQ